MAVRTITGVLSDNEGAPISGGKLRITPVKFLYGRGGTEAILSDVREVVANGSGAVSFDLDEGTYVVETSTSKGAARANMVVDAEGPWDLGRLIDLAPQAVPNAAQAAIDAALRAKAWAESETSPDPEDEASKSAKSWADDAETRGAAQVALATEIVETLEALAPGRTVPTWTALAALTGAVAGEGAEVLDSDTGTHTDPVVGGTVANAGTYSWSASPAGWQRIGGTGLAGKADQTALDALQIVAEMAEVHLERAEASLSPSDDLEQAEDSAGLLWRRTDRDGMQHLPHLDEPVQDAMERRQARTAPFNSRDMEQLRDLYDNIVRRVDDRGAAYFPPGRGPVQHHLRLPLVDTRPRFGEVQKIARDAYAAPVKAAVASLQSECLPYVEPPPMLVPNGYDVPNAVLSHIVLSDDNPVVQLPFPTGDGGAVHPYLLPMRKPFLGYKYLLTDTDHKNSTAGEEVPIMFGTNDLLNYDLIPDVPNPMTRGMPASGGNRPYDGYNSDPIFAYDPNDGALIWGVRETSTFVARNDHIIVSKTYDGVNWTEPFGIDMSVPTVLSPSILWDFSAGLWRMWFITGTSNTLAHYTAPALHGPWTVQSTQSFMQVHGVGIWHAEVKYLGSRFAMAFHTRGADSQVYLALSSDGDAWTVSPGLIQPQSPSVYKPTFFPVFDGENLVRFTFAWSHWEWPDTFLTPWDGMQLYIQRSDWIDISAL